MASPRRYGGAFNYALHRYFISCESSRRILSAVNSERDKFLNQEGLEVYEGCRGFFNEKCPIQGRACQISGCGPCGSTTIQNRTTL